VTADCETRLYYWLGSLLIVDGHLRRTGGGVVAPGCALGGNTTGIIRTHNEAPAVVAMRISNKDCSPARK
jgi:hypothetical protein